MITLIIKYWIQFSNWTSQLIIYYIINLLCGKKLLLQRKWDGMVKNIINL